MSTDTQKWTHLFFVICMSLGVADAYDCNLYGSGSTTFCPGGCCGSSCCSSTYDNYYNNNVSLLIAVIVLSVLLVIALVTGCISFIVWSVRKNRSANQPGVVVSWGTIPGEVTVSQMRYTYPPYQQYPAIQSNIGAPAPGPMGLTQLSN